ncbi:MULTISPECIES: ECF RNA polymerase sigma factor SigK [Streptomyces]|uniref:ECF RNA polymerase sigma factor SigK n=1 Tax=Streptomyces TaxID=1883 RepID=UPI001E3919A8|nr:MULTISPECIES: ECF RNA polymerase sigma factor SigK [Streptomyces]MCZ4102562.1 ECF RNA polymerase sigma factor SigK [Streptomyces sp. H39-C1]
MLVAVGRGDREAFGELYPLIAGPVLGLARRVVGHEGHAEEVCQEAMIAVWRHAARFDPARGSALAWVMTLTHRRAVERVRSAQAAADRDRSFAAGNHHTLFDEVSESVEHRLEHERVRRCVHALTPLQRESVQLAYYDGHTYRETAERLGVPLGTVKTRLRDGMIRLRDCLAST